MSWKLANSWMRHDFFSFPRHLVYYYASVLALNTLFVYFVTEWRIQPEDS
jgi:hypothetical protein